MESLQVLLQPQHLAAHIREVALKLGASRPQIGILAHQLLLLGVVAFVVDWNALVVFGNLTGQDPRSLGDAECSGYELGLSIAQVAALEQIAYDQLAAEGAINPSAQKPWPKAPLPSRCAAAQ